MYGFELYNEFENAQVVVTYISLETNDRFKTLNAMVDLCSIGEKSSDVTMLLSLRKWGRDEIEMKLQKVSEISTLA